MKKLFLLVVFILSISMSGQNVLTINSSASKQSYEINGTTSGDFLIATESSPETIRIQNTSTGTFSSYTTTCSFCDFEINGVNPTTIEQAVELINTITKKITSDVSLQDQHTPVIIAYFSLLEEETLLTNNVAIGDYDITVDVITGIQVGEYISIFNVAANRFYLGVILSISVNTITMDTPMDFAFPSGSFVTSGIRNMNVNGSVTPVVFGLRNTDTAIGSSFDITRLIFTCLTSSSVDLAKFGDIAGGIARGIVVRSKNGVYKNIFNAKTNGDLANLMFNFELAASTNPQQGQDGFTGRMSFAGQGNIGVTLRLAPGEDLQVLIQDDLTSLTDFKIIAEGHLVLD